jgi:hypothetical protein
MPVRLSTRGFLAIYDALAYGVKCAVVWRCRKAKLVELYDANVAGRHLDVGVATGLLRIGGHEHARALPAGCHTRKGVVFEHGRQVLVPGGVLFGATIVGKGVEQSRLCRHALRTNNRRGVLSNLDDSLQDLDAALAGVFGSHHIQPEGAVALFTAHVTCAPTTG